MPKKGSSRVMVAAITLGNNRLVRVAFTGRFRWAEIPLPETLPWELPRTECYIEPNDQPGTRVYLPLESRVELIDE